jgi:hypothetical protein
MPPVVVKRKFRARDAEGVPGHRIHRDDPVQQEAVRRGGGGALQCIGYPQADASTQLPLEQHFHSLHASRIGVAEDGRVGVHP